MQKILITGIAGFIGSFVAKKLSEEGYDLVGIDNFNDYYSPSLKRARLKHVVPESVKVYEFDLCDFGSLNDLCASQNFDCIVHLAAQAGVRYSLERPDIYIESNVQGTNNIFELARKNKISKVVFASSSSVYGQNNEIPFTENQNIDSVVSLYAASKRMNELQAQVYSNLYGITTIGLRFFTVYGSWSRPDMALYKFAKKIVAGETIDVYNYGNLSRDWTHVSDIVTGVCSAVKKEFKSNYLIMNLACGNPIQLLDFINILEKELGIAAKKNLLSMQPGDVYRTFGSIDVAKNLLNYEPKVAIEDGINEFVSWFKEYGLKFN